MMSINKGEDDVWQYIEPAHLQLSQQVECVAAHCSHRRAEAAGHARQSAVRSRCRACIHQSRHSLCLHVAAALCPEAATHSGRIPSPLCAHSLATLTILPLHETITEKATAHWEALPYDADTQPQPPPTVRSRTLDPKPES